MSRTLVILPTYNEAENILKVLDQILSLPTSLEVLVVDDASPDQTSDLIIDTFGGNSPVHLIRRERKLGLGTAYSAGFRYMLENGFTHSLTLDADFSHNPIDIPRFLELSTSCDVVIGSRYVPGGSTVNWGVVRKVLSGTANFVANHFLSLQPRDCTSGFRLYSAQVLRDVQFETITADGYSYLVEILHRASRKKARICEIPIQFVERKHGKSKISRKEIFKAVMTVLRLRFEK